MNSRNFMQPYQFKNGLVIKNRVVMASMTTIASFFNGQITSDELAYYALRAGGSGMLIAGVAYITDRGKGFEGQLGIVLGTIIMTFLTM